MKLNDNGVLHAYGKELFICQYLMAWRRSIMTFKDVLYVPKKQNKLLSLPSITNKGAEVQFKNSHAKL